MHTTHTHEHDHPTPEALAVPALHDLGDDLLTTTPRQRWIGLARPFVGLAGYIAAAALDLWWLTPILVFLIFVAVVTVTHDVVHGTLGLTRRQTEWALFGMGAVLMESGHAYRTTHHRHHSAFPAAHEHDDPEGYPAHTSLIGALVYGPVFLTRLWVWAWQHNRGKPGQRAWLLIEGALPYLVIAVGVALWESTPYVLLYAGLAIVGSWVYPLLTVYLPHRNFGDTPLTQTHTLRGRIIPALFLELTYHLEHHLYPQVPSHHLKTLAARLDPFFERAGVKVWRVP
ncbi:MAG: fatty acid desaturase [bacterium]|nr:fatty acid desaturase [bacterium]